LALPEGARMVQIQIISGKRMGGDLAVSHFPFAVGRAPDADLVLDDDGVWDRHIQIKFDRSAGFVFESQPGAAVLLNGERVGTGFLRNGDSLVLGGVTIRFWLSRTQQRTMRVLEACTWAGLVMLCAAQIALIYRLLR